MIWQASVLTVQILLLVGGWRLFQQARTELNARAAETPVLGEVRALHKSIKQLLQELQTASDQTSERLSERCEEGRSLLHQLESCLDAVREVQATFTDLPTHSLENSLRLSDADTLFSGLAVTGSPFMSLDSGRAVAATTAAPSRNMQHQQVYSLADDGLAPATIAHRVGMSEGEVETLLGLRLQRR